MLIKEKLSMMENCTASEKNIINFFIENVDTLNNASTRSLSKILFCSPSSIVRFCQKLGFTGFEDFKKQYLDEMKYLQSNFHNINPNIPFDSNDNNQKIAHKIAALYKEVVDDCLSLTNHDNLQKSVRLMQTNEDIYIIASSSQIGIAYSFQDKMSKIGKHVSVFTHTDYSYYESHYVKKNKACFILISYTGETERCLRVAEKLNEKNVNFITITSYGKNSLSKISQCCLYASTREKLTDNLGAYSMNLSTLYLLDMLYSLYFNLNYEENYKNKIEISKEYEEFDASTSRITKNSLIK